jgi:hypothetical protein
LSSSFLAIPDWQSLVLAIKPLGEDDTSGKVVASSRVRNNQE